MILCEIIFILEVLYVLFTNQSLLAVLVPLGYALYLLHGFLTKTLHLNFKLANTLQNLITHSVMAYLDYQHVNESGKLCFTSEITSGVHALYQVQLSIWICEGFISMTTEPQHQRRDHVILFCHHIITIALLLVSQRFEYTSVGTLILFYHDFSDIFIDLLKLFNYLKYDIPVYIIYVFNVFSWIYFRLYKFLIDAIIPCYNTCTINKDVICYLDYGLIMLYCMHLFWMYLLIRVAVRLLQGTTPEDAGELEYEE